MTMVHGVYVADVDDDGVNEIMASGKANDFQWGEVTIWSYPDVTNPTISGLTPADGSEVAMGKPTISASLSDDYSGVDVDSVSMTVGGTDVTSDATVTVTSVNYSPPSDLSEGDYKVTVEVSDKSGNTATSTWTFTVKKLILGMDPMMFYRLLSKMRQKNQITSFPFFMISIDLYPTIFGELAC